MKKNMLWMLLSLMAATIMMPLSATAQEAQTETRIAVVSDIHVMAPSLLEGVSESDWNAYYSGQRKMLEQSAGLFDQFINKMEDEEPDILLITGDLTKDGEQASHDYVKAGLETLKNKGIKVYVIPGNHDFGEETLGNDPTKNATKLSSSFASFYTGFGYGIDNDNNFVQDPNGSLSYVAEIADGLYLLAIDSHNNGIVSQNTLTWICDQARVIRGAGKRVIAMMHHPLFPHITGADMFIETYTVANYETVRNALIDAGVNVILTGHFHTSDIAYDWKDDADNGIYDINTGSLISYPCDYRILTLSADKSTLNVNTYSLPETEALQPIESENRVSWKKWLQGRMTAKIAAQGYNTFLAGIAAKAFISHAYGDENNSQTSQAIFSGYEMLKNSNEIDQSQQDTFEPILYSMLKDISNYVDGSLNNGHENRTNDRTLPDIELTTFGTLGNTLNLFNNEDNRTIINLYDGENVTVTLSGRTLYKDGAWNTICLPFSLSAEKISNSLLAGADIRALNTADFDNESNALILNFTTEESITTIEAGRPYIIKWASGDDITTDLTFTGVTINKTMQNDGNPNVVTFRGTYEPISFDSEDNSKLLIGQTTTTLDNKVKSTLFYPEASASIGAFRAYFQLAKGYTAGDLYNPSPGPSEIRNFVLNFGDDDSATGIIAIGGSQLSTLNAQRSEWFTLDGRRLAAKPTAKGLYIHAGRKVVIK